jgi:hypothetical protein
MVERVGTPHRLRGGLLRRNVAEIDADVALQAFGAALAVTHLLTALLWLRVQPLAAMLAPGQDAVCWPFFEQCWAYRSVDPSAITLAVWGYAALGAVTFVVFAAGGRTRLAWLCLAVATAVKVAFLVQDYRLRLNQHYMALWASLIFLLLPHRRRTLAYLLVAFYVWAGTLKLNLDWLSGAALHGRQPYLVPAGLLPLACAYVVVLELVVAPMMLARRAWLFWPALAQVVAFHLASWGVVGFFYPLLMMALLTIFPLARWIPPPAGEATADLLALCAGREPRTTYAVLGAFAALQLVPWLYPGDATLTGEGRLLALHMFDARIECRATATLHHSGGREERIPIATPLPARIECDPIVYLSLANALCRRYGSRPDFIDLDLVLLARRASEPELRTLVDVEGFCDARPTYDLWRHNPWIRTD